MPDEPAADRHIGMFRVTFEAIAALFAPGRHAYNVVDGGIPAGAVVLGAYPADESNVLWVVVELDGPPPAGNGDGLRIREFDPVMRDLAFRCELPTASDN